MRLAMLSPEQSAARTGNDLETILSCVWEQERKYESQQIPRYSEKWWNLLLATATP